MNFQCKNCGGNMVYSPKAKTMYCPYCEGTDCEVAGGDASLTVCASCGGELTIGEFVSASKCPYCGNYLIFDERVAGEYKPDTIIPFYLSKEQAVAHMETEFKKRIFAPVSFLSEKSLEELNGYYVPFFLYDYETMSLFRGTGTKVKTWRSGDYDYTETSYYEIRRKMHAGFDNIPADASTEMDDKTMDLIEPYDYKALMDFDPKFLSGFFSEVYNAPFTEYEDRAKIKAKKSAEALLDSSISGYSTIRTEVKTTDLNLKKTDFALFPVWIYKYSFMGRVYPFFVNGQTGKVIGKTPISKLKVLLYALTMSGGISLILSMILKLLEVI